ncbi:carboxypeptidase Taq [Enterococcus sp. PF1-24]|uniref:carboxypeptidase M32 n=1 Tax=unclassified Enterococcus TaxID=2608891 RepID=UPI002475ED04|nr:MULTISPECIES: carboxypeptidase M32 [unclassified Enterococcus]MDH6365151.1 carboxypeptidase Taq [Enterococcus sp. PFB1-1]MDH6402265.1 carboxypeptidase Taq [Enterococcus sp. PF1-24]
MKEQAFLEKLKEIDLLRQALAVLEWDNQTGMPQAASEARGEVVGYLAEKRFKEEVGPEMKAYLDYFAEHQEELSEVGLAAYQKVAEEYQRNHAIPSAKMLELNKAVSTANSAWLKARGAKDFSLFAEALTKNINLTKDFIPLWQKDEKTPYDVLLNQYEPGLTTEKLDKVFAELLAGITEIRQKLTTGKAPQKDFLSRRVPRYQQEKFIRKVIADLGFDFTRGRLDDTVHPFMLGVNLEDARITTRWNEENFTVAIFGLIHEAGHGMYEQNIDKKYAYTSLCEGTSMGIHESQSLFNELIIGSNREFWKKQYPFLQECTEGTFDDIDFETFYKALYETKASLIRIEADSLTYPIHIIIRYEIEKLIFNENVSVAELPALWNQKYQEYLGVTPENDLTGILQDVHWSGASFGYFPSYALGYMYAAQLHHSMKKELDFDAILASDDYSAILNWLTKNIHQYGASRKPNQLMIDATGETLNPQYLLNYLKGIYYPVYGITE